MKLKILLIAIFTTFCLALSGIAGAQDKPVRYLFQTDDKIVVSGFGGPLVGFSTVMDEFAVTTAGGGAVLFNQTFFIGGYGEGLATEHFLKDLSIYNKLSETNHYYSKMQVTFGHGGLWFGYIHDHHKLVHFGASAKTGVGGIGLTYPGFGMDRRDMLVTDVVFVITPQLEMEINLMPWMKLNFGAGYRMVTGINKTYDFRQPNGEIVQRDYFNPGDFNSPVFTFGVLFGGFGK